MDPVYWLIGGIDFLLVSSALLAWLRRSNHPEQQVRARRLFSAYVLLITLFYTQLFIAKYDPTFYRATFYGWGSVFAIGVVVIRYLFLWSVVNFRPIPLKTVLWTVLLFLPGLFDSLYPIIRQWMGYPTEIQEMIYKHYWGHSILHYNAASPGWSMFFLFGPIFYMLIIQTQLIVRFLRFGRGDLYYFTKRIYLLTIHAFSIMSMTLAFLMVVQVGARYGFWAGLLPISANEGFLPFGIRLVVISHVVVLALFMAIPKLVQFEPIDPAVIRERIQRSFRRKITENTSDESKEHEIITAIRTGGLFTQPDLRVDRLAREMELPTEELRSIFRDEVGLNFNQIVNALRVEHLLILIEEGGLQRYTLEALGNQSGFNSRTTMYRALRRFAPEYAIQM